MTDLSWPFLPNRNIYIERAEGVYLYDRDGQEIIDAAGGAIVVNVGHGRARVAEAVAKATKEYTYVVPPWLTPSREAMLGALGHDWLPDHLTRVHCTSGGSEANEAALKIAIHYQAAIGRPTRSKIIGRSISYHGTTLATASISGHPGRKRGLEGALPAFPEAPAPYPLRCPLGTHHADAGEYYAEALRDVIEAEGPETIAGVLAEPITGSSGGAIVPPDDYWTRVRAICDEYEVLLIMDEVMTGFGRTGVDFGYQHWDIEPDVLISGKGLAGGYAPLGAVFASEAIGQAIESAGFQVMFNTFGAHPAACAAAAEVLRILKDEDLVQQAEQRGSYLQQRLEQAFSNHPNVAEVRGAGLLRAIEIVKDRESLERFEQSEGISGHVVAHGLRNGVFLYGGGTGEVRDIVCMGPPFIISEAQIDQIVEKLSDAVNAVVGNR
jgi:adenosylmethionine-8-amino-7-oxononanoate aminotransferase